MWAGITHSCCLEHFIASHAMCQSSASFHGTCEACSHNCSVSLTPCLSWTVLLPAGASIRRTISHVMCGRERRDRWHKITRHVRLHTGWANWGQHVVQVTFDSSAEPAGLEGTPRPWVRCVRSTQAPAAWLPRLTAQFVHFSSKHTSCHDGPPPDASLCRELYRGVMTECSDVAA